MSVEGIQTRVEGVAWAKAHTAARAKVVSIGRKLVIVMIVSQLLFSGKL
jgi:hypothetical protein